MSLTLYVRGALSANLFYFFAEVGNLLSMRLVFAVRDLQWGIVIRYKNRSIICTYIIIHKVVLSVHPSTDYLCTYIG